jgi:hypothetical protein
MDLLPPRHERASSARPDPSLQEAGSRGATRRFVILDVHDKPLGICGIGGLQEETPEVFYALAGVAGLLPKR